jgi:hypothetical protein
MQAELRLQVIGQTQTSPALVITASRGPTLSTRHAQPTLTPLITAVAVGARHACRRRELGATAADVRVDVGIHTRARGGTIHYLGHMSQPAEWCG